MSERAPLQRQTVQLAPPAPVPAPRQPVALTVQQASAKAIEEDAYRRGYERLIPLLQQGFASDQEASQWIAARRLGGIRDEKLATIQREWAGRVGGHLYPYLLRRVGERPTPALRHAVLLLRQANVRNAPLRAEFAAAYAGPERIAQFAAEFTAAFAPDVRVQGRAAAQRRSANARDADGLAVLRDQPRDVVAAIADAFRARTGRDAVEWLIAEVPRTAAMVAAVAILREATDRTPYVDLACELIPPDNRNDTDPVRLLRSLKHPQRVLLRDRYDALFKDVGPQPGPAPAGNGLVAHLRKTCGIRDVGAYHEALILLYHEPTDAERLFIDLARWEHTKNDSAIALLQDCLRRGVSQQRLIVDWMSFVKGGLNNTTASFTPDPPREHIEAVFFGLGASTRRQLLNLWDHLPDEIAEPPRADAPPRLRLRLADIDAASLEDRRLLAAQQMIALGEGRISPDDKLILDACKEIATILRERIARLTERRLGLLKMPDLDAADRTALATEYDAALGQAYAASTTIRAALTRQFASGAIKLSGDAALHARMLLADDYGPADEMWHALHRDRLEKAVAVIDKLWSAGKVDELHRGAAKPLSDKLGQVVRPAYALAHQRPDDFFKLDHRRVLALGLRDAPDGERGARRIRLEMTEGNSDTDIGRIANLLEHAPGPLRAATVAAFMQRMDGTGAAERLFVEHIHRHYVGELGKDLDAGAAPNFLRLAKLLLPPRTAAEHAAHVHRQRATGTRAKLAGVTAGAADLANVALGTDLRALVERGQDLSGFIAGATPAQLADLQRLTGTDTPEALAEWSAGRFEERQADRHALEETCAQLIAGIVETAVEGGLGLVTGGAGWAAIGNAMIASMISMVATEGLLGPQYQLMSTDNLQAVIASGLGTAMVELKLRDAVVKHMPMKKLEAWGGGAGKHLAQGPQNIATGMIEGVALAGAEMLTDIVARDRLPSAEDFARHAEMVIGRMFAKSISTFATVHHHPGRVNTMTGFGKRVLNNVLFKLALKVTESGAKSIVGSMVNAAPDRTFAQGFYDLLWKEARGLVSSPIRTALSTVASHWNARGERARLDRFQQAEPAAFSALLAHVMKEQFHGPDGTALQAKYIDLHSRPARAEAPLSVEEFMLDELRAKGPAAIKVMVAIDKGMGQFLDLYDHGRPAVGIFAAGGPAPRDLGEIARGMGGARGKPERFRDVPELPAVWQAAIARNARFAGDDGTLRRRVMALMREHLNADPKPFAQRNALLHELLDGESPLAKGVLAGEPAALERFVAGHGSWKQAVEFLEVVGPHVPEAAVAMRQLLGHRDAVVEELRQKFDATLDPGASNKPTSDKDAAFGGHDAGAKLRRAAALMVARYGPHWSEALHMNFYTEGSNLTRYADVAHLMPPERREAVLRELTQDTEVFAFAKMLKAAGSDFKLVGQIETLARHVQVDLTASRALAASTANPKVALAILHTEIDKMMFRFRELGPDKRPKVDGEARVQLAVAISRGQIKANFHTREANIGPGANADILQSVKVQGHEAYQAALSHLVSLVEHRGDVGFERRYETMKYLARIAKVAAQSGAALDAVADMDIEARRTTKHRDRLRKGVLRNAPPLEALRIGGVPKSGELIVEHDAALEALGPLFAQLRNNADRPDQHVRAVPRPPARVKSEAAMLDALGARPDPATGRLVAPKLHPGLTPEFLRDRVGLTAEDAERWQVHYAGLAVTDPHYAAHAQLMREIADTLLNQAP